MAFSNKFRAGISQREDHAFTLVRVVLLRRTSLSIFSSSIDKTTNRHNCQISYNFYFPIDIFYLLPKRYIIFWFIEIKSNLICNFITRYNNTPSVLKYKTFYTKTHLLKKLLFTYKISLKL